MERTHVSRHLICFVLSKGDVIVTQQCESLDPWHFAIYVVLCFTKHEAYQIEISFAVLISVWGVVVKRVLLFLVKCGWVGGWGE